MRLFQYSLKDKTIRGLVGVLLLTLLFIHLSFQYDITWGLIFCGVCLLQLQDYGVTLKDQIARGLAGFLVLFVLFIQLIFQLDFWWFFLGVGLNSFQYSLTGYCPFVLFFLKIGWLENLYIK